MNPRLKQLMQELKYAISGSLSQSERVAHVIAKINDQGFDAFVALEAIVGLSPLEEAAHVVGPRRKNSETSSFAMSATDVRFLKSLRIRVDDAA